MKMKSIDIPNKIIIWGNDNSHALGVIRQFGAHDINVMFLVLGRTHHCATISRYCTKYVCVKNTDAGIHFLLSTYKQEELKPILFVMGDETAEAVDQHRDELLPYFYLTGTTKKNLLSLVDDKNRMTQLASKHGFDTPKSMIFKWNTPIDNIEYPCILKPTIYSGYLEFKTQICWTKEDLQRIVRFLNHNNTYILQQYIPKTYDLLIYGCRLKNGEIKLAGSYYKDRWSDDGGASHGFLVPDIPEAAKKESIYSFLKEINYYGLFSVEYGLLEDKAYFYEFNLRNDGTSHIFYQCGANLPLAWACDCIDIQHDVPTKVKGKQWAINEILDPINISRGVLSKEQWLIEKKQAKAFYFYDPDDKKPWVYAKRYAWINRRFKAILLKYRLLIVYILDKIK